MPHGLDRGFREDRFEESGEPQRPRTSEGDAGRRGRRVAEDDWESLWIDLGGEG